MFWLLVKKELLKHIMEFRFGAALLLCTILTLISVVSLKGDLSKRLSEVEYNSRAYKKQVEGYQHYGELENRGIGVDRPVEKLQVFYYGLEKSPDRIGRVWPHRAISVFEGDPNVNPTIVLFPVADLLFIIGTVMALLAFVFSYDALSGERESGTLKLVLSYSVPRDRVILAKWAGGYLTLLVPLFVSVLLAALIVLTSQDISLSGEQWQAFGLTILVSLIFLGGMFSLGLLVSAGCAHSGTSMLLLLLIWVLFALGIPNLSPYVADLLYSIPSTRSVAHQMDASRMQIHREEERKRIQESDKIAPLSELGVKKWREALERIIARSQEAERSAIYEMERKAITSFERKLQRQIQIAQVISRISPLSSFVYAVTDVASTGMRKERHLADGLRRYQETLARYIRGKVSLDKRYVVHEYDVSDLLLFRYTPEGLKDRVSGVLTDVFLLFGWNVLFFLGTLALFVRADVR